MTNLEILVRRRIEEERAKGTSPERIAQLVQELFNSMDAAQAKASHAVSVDRKS
ncbi:hypothetical protein PY650_20625 [Rhizobium calliandrae]|uniref:Uncharacterized protein n=1 Tax=Rhizobium calliandrae TaxID=1312182 RepID=A0ABT7KL83_9HYPH|nr:hypothetical protein [Rhizobium calliandrae]MDL2408023.1 hypothetical protein [Rhizobium calliandrae]